LFVIVLVFPCVSVVVRGFRSVSFTLCVQCVCVLGLCLTVAGVRATDLHCIRFFRFCCLVCFVFS
jgi:hypothetical protein